VHASQAEIVACEVWEKLRELSGCCRQCRSPEGRKNDALGTDSRNQFLALKTVNLFNYPLWAQTVGVHRREVSLTCGCVTKVTVAKCDRCVNISSTFNGQWNVIKEFYSIINRPTELCLHISPVYVIYISFPETVRLVQKLPVDC
jgi:hypothetical protein